MRKKTLGKEAGNMKIVMLACTWSGIDAMEGCREALKKRLPEAEILAMGRCSYKPGYEDGPKLSEVTEEWFDKADALVFFSAVGIAVRCIAPFVRDKYSDPAVVVVDEGRRFAIPILSGHSAGANKLARILANELGAQPVVTTATDARGIFSVDEFAKNNGLAISDRRRAKEISAWLLSGKRTGVFADGLDIADDEQPGRIASDAREEDDPVKRETKDWANMYHLTELLQSYGRGADQTLDRARAHIILSWRCENMDHWKAVCLIPKIITVGIGCRRGVSCERIGDAFRKVEMLCRIHAEALAGIASIELKKDEEGLLEFAGEMGLPITFYSAQELRAVPGRFSSSAFVEETVGVDNVCERSAVLLAGEGGCLILKKQEFEGVTIALGMVKSGRILRFNPKD